MNDASPASAFRPRAGHLRHGHIAVAAVVDVAVAGEQVGHALIRGGHAEVTRRPELNSNVRRDILQLTEGSTSRCSQQTAAILESHREIMMACQRGVRHSATGS